jgi:hypothetical protein
MADVEEFLESCELVADPEDAESWMLSWTNVVYGSDHLSLRVLVETHRSVKPNQTWEIRADNLAEVRLEAGRSHGAALTRDHVILWPFKEQVSQLNFSGPSASHERLLWELYELHHVLTKGLIPFDRFLNPHFTRNRLSGGFGVLAKGPDRLLREYASVLKKSDLEPYFPYPPKLPLRMDEDRHQWIVEDRDLSVLILGKSHIIGTNFTAVRV